MSFMKTLLTGAVLSAMPIVAHAHHTGESATQTTAAFSAVGVMIAVAAAAAAALFMLNPNLRARFSSVKKDRRREP
ncbi:MAG: hypothetical protein AAGD92_04105 [Pseudomonadota bacterium]